MNRVAEKKIFRKVNRFLSNLSPSDDLSKHLERSRSSSSSICITNAGLANGFTKEEIFEILQPLGEIKDLLMFSGKSFCVVNFKNVADAAECVRMLNGSYILKEESQPVYMYFLEPNNDGELKSHQEIINVWPPGLVLKEDFVSEEEETLLMNLSSLKVDVSCLKHRSVKHFGFEFDYESSQVNRTPIPVGIPPEMETLTRNIAEQFHLEKPDQLTVNHYEPGQGIPPHVDTHSSFEDGIVSLSLGSDIVMDFRHPDGSHANITLPRRSCMVLTGEARYLWNHGITPRKHDVISTPTGVTLLRRGTRMSLTFRKVHRSFKCDCPYPGSCDTRSFDNSTVLSEENANNLEINHVFHVYDEIAAHFSETRHQQWPNVHQFIQSFSVGSIFLDVGCGNGKYLKSPQLYMVGCDRSRKLLEICRTNKNEVVNADCRYSPIRDEVVDGIICIAVIHHLATEERRLQSIKDICRLLCQGGRALIYVWAKEQEIGHNKSTYLLQNKKITPNSAGSEEFPPTVLPVHENRTNFKHSDLLVPWKTKVKNDTKTHLRFYHVFQNGELESLCSRISGITIMRSFYDQGNWCIEIQKTC